MDLWLLIPLLLITFVIEFRDRLESFVDGDRDDDQDELEQLRDRYVDGEISIAEFEARTEILLDDDARELRDRLEDDVDGIGPEIAATVAQEFGSVDAIATAGRDDLERVDGVGEKRAAAIRDVI